MVKHNCCQCGVVLHCSDQLQDNIIILVQDVIAFRVYVYDIHFVSSRAAIVTVAVDFVKRLAYKHPPAPIDKQR